MPDLDLAIRHDITQTQRHHWSIRKRAWKPLLDLATLIIAGKSQPLGQWEDSSRPAMCLPKMLLVVQPKLNMACQPGWSMTGSAVQALR